MKQLLSLFLLVTFFYGCKNSKEEVKEDKPKYDLYQPSEMALLMEHMYNYNLLLKKDIIDGNVPNEFPDKFLEIHSAKLTNTFERDENFENFSKLYLKAEHEIFNTESEIPLADRYNNMVNLCIACHQTSCTGPIPRIKKLLIQ